jgi:hypothetical protein
MLREEQIDIRRKRLPVPQPGTVVVENGLLGWNSLQEDSRMQTTTYGPFSLDRVSVKGPKDYMNARGLNCSTAAPAGGSDCPPRSASHVKKSCNVTTPPCLTRRSDAENGPALSEPGLLTATSGGPCFDSVPQGRAFPPGTTVNRLPEGTVLLAPGSGLRVFRPSWLRLAPISPAVGKLLPASALRASGGNGLIRCRSQPAAERAGEAPAGQKAK